VHSRSGADAGIEVHCRPIEGQALVAHLPVGLALGVSPQSHFKAKAVRDQRIRRVRPAPLANAFEPCVSIEVDSLTLTTAAPAAAKIWVRRQIVGKEKVKA